MSPCSPVPAVGTSTKLPHRPTGPCARPWPARPLMLWSLAVACLVSGGCKVGPDYRAPEPRLPEQFSEAAGGPAATQPAEDTLMRWWTTFRDPKLNELIERAGQGNLDLRLAEARIREARALRDVAAADLWPSLNIGGGYAWKGTSLNAQPRPEGGPDRARQLAATAVRGAGTSLATGFYRPGQIATSLVVNELSSRVAGTGTPAADRAFNLFQLGFDARWEIDIFGGLRRSVEAADAEVDATIESQRDILVTVTAEVARNYIEVRSLQRRIAIAEENIHAQRELLELSRSRWQAGLTSELDVAQAEAQLAFTTSQVPLLTAQLHQALHRLAVLLGQDPGALKAELAEAGPIPATLPTIPPALPSDLLRRRPDIRRAERQLAAATARIGVAAAELFPRFALTGSFGTATTDMQRFLDRPSFLWSVGPEVSWPLLDGGRIRANIRLSEARTQQALTLYEQTVLAALQEVSDALAGYREEQARFQHLAATVEANRRAMSLSNERYARGLTDFLAVLDSERSLYQSQDLLVQSETTAAATAVALYKALGGGWQPGSDQTRPALPEHRDRSDPSAE